MPVLIGATVVHRVRINHRRGTGITACGQRFSLSHPGYDPAGQEPVQGLCNHCRDRWPAWERLKHERARRRRAAS